MKDLIEERDKKEKMQHSIVKWWNVHYMTPDELEAEQAKAEGETSDSTDDTPDAASDAASDSAMEIFNRLQREAEEDEARKRREIEQVRLEAEANFNETTGAYSGSYGSGGVKKQHQEQIDSILAEKDEELRKLIESAEEN